MALFTYEGQGATWQTTDGYVDISMFGDDGSPQPPGRSIMRYDSWPSATPLSQATVDWSRILAVVIDEPYVTRLQLDYGDYDEANPCSGGFFGGGNPTRRAHLAAIRHKLMNAVSLVHDVAPRTRVWVNFHQREVKWMRADDCEQLNDHAIDVVSLDRYEVDFSDIADEYAWFISAMPQQQLAVVPGTHFRIGGDSPSQAAARLQDYFGYVNRMNRQCGLALGRVGPTGNDDGCRVWIVAGWSAIPEFAEGGRTYVGLTDPRAADIKTAWLEQLSKVRGLEDPYFGALAISHRHRDVEPARRRNP